MASFTRPFMKLGPTVEREMREWKKVVKRRIDLGKKKEDESWVERLVKVRQSELRL